MRNHETSDELIQEPSSSREKGSALMLAMVIILILTMLGFGMLTRTLLVSEMAGAERWTTQTFFAADAGIEIAKERLKVNFDSFSFQAQDLRGTGVPGQAGLIDVTVSAFNLASKPSSVEGSEISGGQGSGGANILTQAFRGTSLAVANRTRSEARIQATLKYEPFIPTITYSD